MSNIFLTAFVTGRTNNRVVTGTAKAGAYQISVPSASSYFSQGQFLFIAQNNSDGIEFLGKVTAVDGTTVTGTYPVIQDKASTFHIWIATVGFQFTNNFTNTLEEDENASVETSIVKAGIPYSTKTADTIYARTLQWVDVLRIVDITTLRAFRAALLALGTTQFTFIDVDRAVHSAYLLSYDYPKRATREFDEFNNQNNPSYATRAAEYNLTVEIMLDTEGEYV